MMDKNCGEVKMGKEKKGEHVHYICNINNYEHIRIKKKFKCVVDTHFIHLCTFMVYLDPR